MIVVNTYALYENGSLVFEGSSREIEEHYNTTCHALQNYVDKGHKFLKKYDVKYTGTKKIPKYAPKPKTDNKLNYLLEHLKRYGNTVLSRKPDEYLIKLKEHGFNCKARKVTDVEVKKRKKSYYIIEVI